MGLLGRGRRFLALSVAYYVGMLVFLVGVSVAFESILFGVSLILASLLVFPNTRSAVADRYETNVPTTLVVVVVLASLAAPSLVFDDYESGTYFGTDDTVEVRVSHDGAWSADISTMNSFRHVEGRGTRRVTVTDDVGMIEITAEKDGDASGRLSVAILVDGAVVSADIAEDGDPRASTEHSVGFLP